MLLFLPPKSATIIYEEAISSDCSLLVCICKLEWFFPLFYRCKFVSFLAKYALFPAKKLPTLLTSTVFLRILPILSKRIYISSEICWYFWNLPSFCATYKKNKFWITKLWILLQIFCLIGFISMVSNVNNHY